MSYGSSKVGVLHYGGYPQPYAAALHPRTTPVSGSVVQPDHTHFRVSITQALEGATFDTTRLRIRLDGVEVWNGAAWGEPVAASFFSYEDSGDITAVLVRTGGAWGFGTHVVQVDVPTLDP